MFAVDLCQCTQAQSGDNLRDLWASSRLAEGHGVLFRAGQVSAGTMGWWSGPTSALETDRRARDFGLILYYLCDDQKKKKV